MCVYYVRLHVFAFHSVSFVLPFCCDCTTVIECMESYGSHAHWIIRSLLLFRLVNVSMMCERKPTELSEKKGIRDSVERNSFVRKRSSGWMKRIILEWKRERRRKTAREKHREWDWTSTTDQNAKAWEQLHMASLSFKYKAFIAYRWV